MNLLAIIGNAAVDPMFRQRLLDDPVAAAAEYGLTLTKFEAYLLQTVFASSQSELEAPFMALQDALYRRLPLEPETKAMKLVCPRPPCFWSLQPPGEKVEEQK